VSEALYKLGGLRFWAEDELALREAFQARAVSAVKAALLALNPAWRFARMEGPCLSPRDQISASYDDNDLFATNHIAGGSPLYLRAETTPTSYAYARHLGGKMPLCVWQAGKSFRRETNDGASAAKLRFNEFWQLEFQCIYRSDTKADYRAALIPAVELEIRRVTMADTRIVPSDRVPGYAESTLDIEARYNGKWREMASCSIRTDYAEDMRVCEIAIGLDRIATLAAAPLTGEGL
jgi:glycyl-tRNA synthetase